MKTEQKKKFHFKEKLFDCGKTTYYPSEDSYFLAGNIKITKNSTVIDIGCGAGIQTLNALLQGAAGVLAADINQEALEITERNCKTAGFEKKITTKKSDLFENIMQTADVIIFNPPYVPSEDIKFSDLDGGRRGREILDRFLLTFLENLNENGKCYFLQTDINGYSQTKKILKGKKIKCRIIAKKKGFFEELAVFECMKNKTK